MEARSSNSDGPRREYAPKIVRLAGIVFSLIVGGLGLVPSAAAESPGEGFSERSKKYYDRGKKYFDNGKFRRAADKLRQAYALTPNPVLLYNIALAEWRAGNIDRARKAATRASEEGLPDRIATRNEARLAAFGAIASAQFVGGNVAESTPNQRERAGEKTPARTERRRFGGLGWAGVGTTVGGLAGLATAIWLDFQVGDAVTRAENARSDGDVDRANRIFEQEIRPKQRAGRIFLGSGAALAAGGLTMLIVELATVETTETVASALRRDGAMFVGPAVRVGSGGASLELQIRFP